MANTAYDEQAEAYRTVSAGDSSLLVTLGQVTVTTTATAIVAADATGKRVRVQIQNVGATDMFVGTANTVTTANGFKVPAGTTMPFAIDGTGAVYGIVAAGTTTVNFMSTGR